MTTARQVAGPVEGRPILEALPAEAPITSFAKLICASMERRWPSQFATAGDNCGLTIGSLREAERGGSAVIVLCVDLTEQVLAEAVSMHADYIISYTPVPRNPLPALRVDDPTGRVVLKLAQQSIAVFSAGSACTNAPRGAASWLAESLASGSTRPLWPHADDARAGEGRLLECHKATSLSAMINRLKEVLGVRHLRLAMGVLVDEQSLGKALECCFIKSVALQLGDGASALRGCDANMYVTSEMSHADVLEANAAGVIVLLAGQSTIERAYLRALREELHDEFANAEWQVKVKCSQVDCNPLAVV